VITVAVVVALLCVCVGCCGCGEARPAATFMANTVVSCSHDSSPSPVLPTFSCQLGHAVSRSDVLC
jgi:hypothetical protein